MIRPWVWLLALTVLTVSAVDALLLQVGLSYFTSGWHADHLDSPVLIASFLVMGGLADVAFVAVLWAVGRGRNSADESEPAEP